MGRSPERGRGGRNNRLKMKFSYKVLRQIVGEGYDIRGRPTDGVWEEIEIKANIQGALIWNRMKITDSGEKVKSTISIRSNEPLFMSRTDVDGKLLQADRVIYQGAFWEVRDRIAYDNLKNTAHDEILAVLMDEQVQDREINMGGCDGC